MFSSALKSFSSNIGSNYTVAPNPTSVCGPWKIYDARKKTGGKAVSVFVFERKSLEPGATLRSTGGSLKQAHDEIVERLKKEASSLARLRHPSILELAEPVEETRAGGLTFATEPITASLAGLLEEKDEQERAGGVGGRTSKYVVEDPAGGGKRRREVEIDELEIQKGLLQVGKGLEFLHESARLVHANLTPEAIFINAKSDWKISGLGFSTPPESTENPSVSPMQLSEVLNYDNRLPRSVQLNLDYSSPDFVMDNNVTTSADMFSLGLIIVALYNSPHRTPLETNNSVSTYKRLLSSPNTTPTQRNNYLASQSIPRDVINSLLPRLITRRPANRMTAREFQQTQYFDSILVSTLRFLDSLPAKTPHEKSQFMRGLPRIMPQFPKSVLEKKILPALLEEMKDPELLSLILDNVFKIVETVPNSKRTFSEKVVPRLREVFLVTASGRSKTQERDTSKEGGLLIILDNMKIVATNCTGKEFKDDILPLIYLGLDSPTHSVQDAALQTMMTVLPVLDFSTIKNELFPAVAHVFSKTSSMVIKIKGLEALNILCGGTSDEFGGDQNNLMGTAQSQSKSSSSSLDKYTVQEKVVPLLKGIKTKEPAVMMAALNVFTQVGKVADATFLAMDVLPCLWQFSLGPLLSLEQFQQFIALIKSLSTRVEEEQTRKLQQLSSAGRGAGSTWNKGTNGAADEGDFETLVTGRKANTNGNSDSWDGGWDNGPSNRPASTQIRPQKATPAASFSWSSSSPSTAQNQRNQSPMKSQLSRTVTPDTTMSSFTPLQPSSRTTSMSGSQGFQPMQPQSPGSNAMSTGSVPNYSNANSGTSINWSSMGNSGSNPWASAGSSSSVLQPQSSSTSGWANTSNTSQQSAWASQSSNLANSLGGMTIAPPPSNQSGGAGGFGQTQKTGLDKYDSLL